MTLPLKLVKTKTKRGYNFTKAIVVGTVPVPKIATDENGVDYDTETGEVIPQGKKEGGLFEEKVPF